MKTLEHHTSENITYLCIQNEKIKSNVTEKIITFFFLCKPKIVCNYLKCYCIEVTPVPAFSFFVIFFMNGCFEYKEAIKYVPIGTFESVTDSKIELTGIYCLGHITQQICSNRCSHYPVILSSILAS